MYQLSGMILKPSRLPEPNNSRKKATITRIRP